MFSWLQKFNFISCSLVNIYQTMSFYYAVHFTKNKSQERKFLCDKPIPCKECSKPFSESSMLKMQLWTHTWEKYICFKERSMPAFKITNQPKTSENKTQTQNSAHEGIKFHQPNFFQTSSDMCWWISESFINLGQFLDMEMNFWMKLVPPKNVTKSGCFSSNFFANAKFSSRRNGSLVFKLL